MAGHTRHHGRGISSTILKRVGSGRGCPGVTGCTFPHQPKLSVEQHPTLPQLPEKHQVGAVKTLPLPTIAFSAQAPPTSPGLQLPHSRLGNGLLPAAQPWAGPRWLRRELRR